jgi:energy-coupling factor transport system ATP-binding protein
VNSRADPFIWIDHVNFAYPNGMDALQDINLCIYPGEVVGIIGENGAGKSTLVKHLNGLLKPCQGTVLIDGRDSRKFTSAALARWVGLCFQNPDDQLFQNKVQKEIVLGPRNLGFDPKRIQEQSSWALDLVGMRGRADDHPYDLDLSGRKLVAIAAILAMDTPVIILDEPTTGQDQVGIEVLERVIQKLKDMHKTILTISHDMEFVARNCPRVVAMANTRILMDATVEEVFHRDDVLAQAGVEPPIYSQLSRRLGWEGDLFSADQFVDRIHAQRAVAAQAKINTKR